MTPVTLFHCIVLKSRNTRLSSKELRAVFTFYSEEPSFCQLLHSTFPLVSIKLSYFTSVAESFLRSILVLKWSSPQFLFCVKNVLKVGLQLINMSPEVKGVSSKVMSPVEHNFLFVYFTGGASLLSCIKVEDKLHQILQYQKRNTNNWIHFQRSYLKYIWDQARFWVVYLSKVKIYIQT